MSTTEDTNATRRGSGSNDLLGQASEAVPLVERLREMSRRGYWPLLGDEAADEIERLRRALHDVAEEWAGAECGEPVHAQEAYAIGLAKRMYALAVEGLRPNVEFSGRTRSAGTQG